METRHRHRSTPQLILGLLIVCVGVLFTLDTLGIADAQYYLRYWPVGVIAIGLSKLWHALDGHGGMVGSVLLLIIGSWLLLDELNMVRLDFEQLWPLLLVLVGTSLVWRSVTGRRVPASDDTNSTLSAVAVLAGINRGNNSRTFRGGDLTAIMGGCEVDLRQASIDGEATIDVFAMWGGIEIRVPEDWTVIGRVTPLMGGFDDKTRPPQGTGTHRLIIRGLVIMGGVEVKN